MLVRELVGCNVLLRHAKALTPTCTCHLTTRLASYKTWMRAKYKQPYATQSEVACTRSHLTVNRWHALALTSPLTSPSCLRSRDRLSEITSKRQSRTRVSHPYTHTLAQIQTQNSTRADEFILPALDPVPRSLHQHLAELLS